MARYILRRLALSIPVLIGVSIAVFSMLHLVPGDPVSVMLGDTASSPERVAALKHELGLDQPIYVQYFRYMGRVLHGNLGRSIRTNQPVATIIRQQLPSTVELTLAAMVIAITAGLLLGALAATRHRSWLDVLTMAIATLGVSMPSFWLGFMLILFFAVKVQWLPIAGGGDVKHLILPAITLGFSATAIIARLTRSSLLEALGQDFIRTARAKGLLERVVVYRHALKNALIPVVTIVGLQFGALLAGTVIIETVFSRPGLGRDLIGAIQGRDFPVAQGMILFVAVVYVVVNLIVDLAYGLLDPRIRYS